MPLRLRLAVLFALVTAALVTVAGFVFVLQLRVSVDASLDPGLRARVATIANELGSDEQLPSTGLNDGVVQVSGPDGQILVSSADAGTAPLLDPAQRAAATAGEISFTATVNGDRSRVLATTVAGTRGHSLVVVGTGTDVSDAAVDRATSALLVGGPPAVLLAGIGAWLLAGSVLRPVERMRRQAATISDQDLSRRLAVPPTRDEIAALGTTMNALLHRLQAALERERGFVADAGHELRTPLAILRTELELAARPGRSREALVDAVSRAGQETDRLIRLAEDLLLLARSDNHQPFVRPAPLSLPTVLDAAARGAATRAGERAVTVTVHAPDELVIYADADRLRQAVDNLLDNATRHAPDGTVVDVTMSTSPAGTVTIEVADRGTGFPEDFLPHAFERFHRSEAARTRDSGGTGLGLSIVRAIAQAHGGDARAANRPGGGAVVSIDLPDPVRHRVEPAGPSSVPAGSRRSRS